MEAVWARQQLYSPTCPAYSTEHFHLDPEALFRHRDCAGLNTKTYKEERLQLQFTIKYTCWSVDKLVLQCSDCRKTYAKKFLRPYFLCRSKQGNEDC